MKDAYAWLLDEPTLTKLVLDWVFFQFGFLVLNLSETVDRTLKKTEDLSEWLESAYNFLAMVNYPYSANFMMPLPGHPIREVS